MLIIIIMGFQSTHSLRSATRYQAENKAMSEFQSTHSLRSATVPYPALEAEAGFQSTHSLRSATVLITSESYTIPVSIHALLAECD